MVVDPKIQTTLQFLSTYACRDKRGRLAMQLVD